MRNNNLQIDKLENRVCLDAAPVMGPAIPDHLDYTPPPVLLRFQPVVESEIKTIEDLVDPRDEMTGGDTVWDEGLDGLFAAYAQDGEVDLREARNLVVNSTDDGFVSRFEVFQTWRYLYDLPEVFTPQALTFMINVVQGSEDNAVFSEVEKLGWDTDIQPLADGWYFSLRD